MKNLFKSVSASGNPAKFVWQNSQPRNSGDSESLLDKMDKKVENIPSASKLGVDLLRHTGEANSLNIYNDAYKSALKLIETQEKTIGEEAYLEKLEKVAEEATSRYDKVIKVQAELYQRIDKNFDKTGEVYEKTRNELARISHILAQTQKIINNANFRKNSPLKKMLGKLSGKENQRTKEISAIRAEKVILNYIEKNDFDFNGLGSEDTRSKNDFIDKIIKRAEYYDVSLSDVVSNLDGLFDAVSDEGGNIDWGAESVNVGKVGGEAVKDLNNWLMNFKK